MYNNGDDILIKVKYLFYESKVIRGKVISRLEVEYDDWLNTPIKYNEYKINLGNKIITVNDSNNSLFGYCIVSQ